jgi:hypothetical protein
MVFAKVDTEAEPELAAAFGIMSIPTRMVFRDQIVRLLVSIGSPTSKPKRASPTNRGLTDALDEALLHEPAEHCYDGRVRPVLAAEPLPHLPPRQPGASRREPFEDLALQVADQRPAISRLGTSPSTRS